MKRERDSVCVIGVVVVFEVPSKPDQANNATSINQERGKAPPLVNCMQAVSQERVVSSVAVTTTLTLPHQQTAARDYVKCVWV
jgi:hypothetical protein